MRETEAGILNQKIGNALLKGFFDIRKPPTTKIGSTTMKMKPVIRYLGIHLGTRMNITPHIKYVTEKSRNLFAGLVKLAIEHWGLNTRIIRIIYTGLVIPILCYAAAGWSERLNAHHHRKRKDKHYLLKSLPNHFKRRTRRTR